MSYTKQEWIDGKTPLDASHFNHMEKGIEDAHTGIIRVESYIDDKPMINLRDLESGVYMLYGYFSPYANSDSTIAIDNELVHVARLNAGSHIMNISPLNAKLGFVEILVDDTAYGGHTFTRQSFDMLAINGLLDRVAALEAAAGINPGEQIRGTRPTVAPLCHLRQFGAFFMARWQRGLMHRFAKPAR